MAVVLYAFIIVTALFAVAARCDGTALDGPLDLSWSYDETARQCPGEQDFKFLKKMQIRNEKGVWFALNTFAVAEHCGTHIDAPYHFNPDGVTVEKIPLEKLLTIGVFIDASEEVGDDNNYTMTLSKVKMWEEANGPIPENSVVMVRLGWAKHYTDKDKYLGYKDNGFSHPGIAVDVAHYLVNSKKVVGVGVDCSSIDPGYDDKYSAHVVLNKAGIYILENVAITGSLPPKFKLIVAPMKIGSGTGGPVRLIALPSDYNF